MTHDRLAAWCLMVLVVLVSACAGERAPSRGFLLDVATAPERCGESRAEVLTALGQRRVQVTYDLVLDMDSMGGWVRDRLQTRAYKFVYVKAEPGGAIRRVCGVS